MAHVKVKIGSRDFAIERGVKQGDPISALLFIAVMQDLCGKVDESWQGMNRKRRGIKVGLEVNYGNRRRTLTNLRFADDVILMAQSSKDIGMMLNTFSIKAADYGLKLNLDKTKVMTWDKYKANTKPIHIRYKSIPTQSQTNPIHKKAIDF